MATKNVIEINGKMYDAHSGALISGSKKPSVKTESQQTTKIIPRPKPRSIDGFSKSSSKAVVPKKPAGKPQISTISKAHNKTHKPAPNLKHSIQKSRPLNRKAVSAPKIEVEKSSLPNSVTRKESGDKRLQRAMQVSKSSIVTKFSNMPKINHTVSELKNTEVARKVLAKPIQTAPSTKANTAIIHEPVINPVNKVKKNHKIKKHISRAGYAIITICIIIIAGYVAYLNIPSLSIKVASSQAGFTASLPQYTPAGYKVSGPVKYASGIVTINYESTSDDKSFNLTQEPTTWDSLALKENYIDTQTKLEPITQQYNGLTIYLFEGKAAWVNAGKQFILNTNNSQLPVDEILKLAASV